MHPNSRKVSVIVPTYNERDNIAPLVQRLSTALSGYDHEILFIDDNSRDGTAELARALASNYSVRVIVRQDKRGLASAVVDGFKEATGEVLVVMDADLQHPPELVPQLVMAIKGGADIAVASRYIKGGGCPGWGLMRRVMSKGALILAHVLLPKTRGISDPMSGFFALDRRVVAQAPLDPVGYKILLEILMLGRFSKASEVPYLFGLRSGGESKLSTRQQVDYVKHLYSLMRRTGELKRFIRFIAVGLSGVIVNQGLLWLLTEFAGLKYYISAIFAIEASIISNFILNDYFTFADRRSGKTMSFLGRLLKFNLICLAGAGIQYGLLVFFTSVLGVYYLVSNLIGIVVAFLWNYFVNTWWTWR